MTHDPMCDTVTGNDWSLRCDCALIARVREDERARMLTLADDVKAAQYEAGRRDQKAEWQTVLASTNTRARIDALKQARDFLLAHDRSTTLTQLNAWMVQP